VGVVEGLGDPVAQEAQVIGGKALQVGEPGRVASQQPGELHHLGMGLQQVGGAAHPTTRFLGPRSSRGMWLSARSPAAANAAA
jgi:hypothetical protein